MFMPLVDKLCSLADSSAFLSRVWFRHSSPQTVRDRYTEDSKMSAARALFVESPLVGKFIPPAHGYLLSYLFACAVKDENAELHLTEFKEELKRQNADVPDQDIESSVAKAQGLLVAKPRFFWF